MWEQRISHEGLNAYRVVKGATQEDVNLKAQYQLAAWEDKWLRIHEMEEARQNKQEASQLKGDRIELAKQQTEQASIELERLATTLSRELTRTYFDWEGLKSNSRFVEEEPRLDAKKSLPIAPDRNSFSTPLSFFDKLVPSSKRRKQDASEARFRQAHEEWRAETTEIQRSNEFAEKEFQQAINEWQRRKDIFLQIRAAQHLTVEQKKADYLAMKQDELLSYWYEVLAGADNPPEWPQEVSLAYIAETKMLVVDYELPRIEVFPNVKEVKYIAAREEFKQTLISDVQLKKAYDDVLYQLPLSTMHRLFTTDDAGAIDSITFNGWVHSIDKATGVETHPCVMSVQASKQEFLSLKLSHVDPRQCFKKMKGVSATKLAELSPVKPILLLNKDDSRFIPAYNVADALDSRTNLAAMDWLDFENLIREIFEKEFSRGGGEVKITQASRDGGVDAIAFDPDPIRGGKIVIQAKRYTNAVGVSAVRDLYGTVHNEGATKGILVTTSNFGSDAYEFAKGKPLTLLSGNELLYLLQQHGYQAKIDITEAKHFFAADAARITT